MYGLGELRVDGDGACQFRALSDQLYRSPRHHRAVRTAVVAQLRRHAERYEAWVPMDYEGYLDRMARPDEWGDHVTLQAAADVFQADISVITSFPHQTLVSIKPVGGAGPSERGACVCARMALASQGTTH
jgi:hypothetical protein